MNESDFLSVFGLLAAAYPKTELPDQTIQVYQVMLGHIDSQTLLSAALLHIASSRFFPTVQELLQACQNANGADQSPYEAWDQVRTAIASGFGRQTHPDELTEDILSPRARQAALRVGWRDICMSENISVERAHFIAAYKEIQESSKINDLVGIIEPVYQEAVKVLAGDKSYKRITERAG